MTQRPVRLTKTYIDRLEAREREYSVHDAEISGFGIRVLPSGKKYAFIRYRTASAGRRRVTIGPIGPVISVAQARVRAAELLRDVCLGNDPAGERKALLDAPTFSQAFDRYIETHAEPKLRPRTVAGYKLLWRKHIKRQLGSTKVAAIDRGAVEAMHVHIGKKATGAANRALELVSAILARCQEWGWREGGDNPCRSVVKFKGRKIERMLSSDERQALERAMVEAAAASPGHANYVSRSAVGVFRLLILTGARLSEITNLRWRDVDIVSEHPELKIEQYKERRTRAGAKRIPLSSPAVAVLDQARAGRSVLPGAFVFVGETGKPLQNVQRAWRSIRRSAGLDDLRIHDLRHSFASAGLEAGVSLEVIGRVLGHRAVATTARYAHLCDSARRDAVDLIGAAIARKTAGEDHTDLAPLRRLH